MLRGRGSSIAFGAGDLATAALVLLGVFGGLPDRWWVVDAAAIVVGLLLGAAGGGLLADARWAGRVARVAAGVSLALGLALVFLLAISASYLSGIYAPVGPGGAVILVLVMALALPYLVIFPSVQLLWLGRRGDRELPA